MLKITRNGSIKIPRGDTGYFSVKRIKDSEILPFEDGDVLKFTVKKTANDTEIITQKTVDSFTDGCAVFKIDPVDTKSLNFGVYQFDVQATYKNGDIDTLVGPNNFYVGEEITYE